jgi:hypothetical protein
MKMDTVWSSEMSADFDGLFSYHLYINVYQNQLLLLLLLLGVHTSKKLKVEHEEMLRFFVIFFSSSTQVPA